MWKCTLVLLYYLSTLLATTFISLIDGASENFTTSILTTTSTSPADDDASLADTHKIVAICSALVAIFGFLLTVLQLRKRQLLCFRKRRGEPTLRDVTKSSSEQNTSIEIPEEEQSSDENCTVSMQGKRPFLRYRGPSKGRNPQRPTQSKPQNKQTVPVTAPTPAVLEVTFDMEKEKPDVLWYKEDIPITETGRYKITTQRGSTQLTVQPTEVGDSGDYTCIVRNDKGDVKNKIHLEVKECDNDDVKKPLDFTDIKAKMIKKYKEKKIIKEELGEDMYIIYELPGEEDFHLDLRKDEHLMEVDFTSKKRLKAGLNPLNKAKYVDMDYKQIEDIIKELFTENTHRLVKCTAHAGYGKTIFANKLLSDWLYKPDLQDIGMVMFIPIREIDPKATLEDMLGEKGLQLLDQKDAEHIVKYLKTGHEKSSIVVLDGADEKDIPEDCELYSLITGDICKSTKVLITGRPEAKLFEKSDVVPDYKIEISGTTKQSAIIYIQKRIETTKNIKLSESDIKLIEKEYIEACKDSEFLTVPIYLTLITIMLNELLVKGADFSLLKMPKTMTEFFNGFFRILFRKWAYKIQDNNPSVNHVTFDTNPFDETSTVPIEIQQKLFFMTKLSYTLLKDYKYEISNEDLKSNGLSPEDIKVSGLFCHSDMIYYYRHKLLAEYMSALYFVHPCCTEQIGEVPVKKQTLTTIFHGLSNVPKFIFGLKPSKGKEIIERLRGHTLTETCWSEPCIKYEAELCNEANDKEVIECMVKLLCDSETYQSEFSICDNKNKDKFYKSLTGDQSTSLLSKWYNLKVDSETETDQWCLVRGGQHKNVKMEFDTNTNHVSGLTLTDTLLCLIHVYMFPTMSSADICLVPISTIFPELKHLVLSCKFTSTIRHIKLPHFIPHHFNEILKLNELESLLIGTKLPDISFNRFDIKLGKLHTLEHNGMIGSENTQLFLKSLPELSVLSLDLTGTLQTLLADGKYFQCIQGIANLKKLHMHTYVSRGSMQKLCDIIKEMNQLTDIGFDMCVFLKHGSKFMLNNLMQAKTISSIEILYDTLCQEYAEQEATGFSLNTNRVEQVQTILNVNMAGKQSISSIKSKHNICLNLR